MTREEARRQRRELSAAELDVWNALAPLRDAGLHVRKQHPIGRYIADFAVARARLAIEVDGPFHDWPENLVHEEARQAYIENMGWRVVRIPSIRAHDADFVRETVRAALPPSPRGEGAGGWGEPPNEQAKAPKRITRRTRANRVLPPRSQKSDESASPHPLPPPLAGRGLRQRLIAQIAQTGPISVAQFMQAALYDPQHGYYMRAADIARDFITAPESSQMFGELIGLWCVHEWRALGAPRPFHLIEHGPGSGALMADALRAAKLAPDFLAAARVHLVETSPHLRAAQKSKLDALGVSAEWNAPPPGAPALIVMNEFLDCLPIRQFVRSAEGWRERHIGIDANGALAFGLGGVLPGGPNALIGAVREEAPGLRGVIDDIRARLTAAPGRALIIDYAGDGMGDTLQALRAHQKLSPLEAPGESDLTARVDYAALQLHAEGLRIDGPNSQAAFLRALGLDQRAHALATKHPDRAERIAREHQRLTAPDQMGDLFQAICLSSPHLPPAAGF